LETVKVPALGRFMPALGALLNLIPASKVHHQPNKSVGKQ